MRRGNQRPIASAGQPLLRDLRLGELVHGLPDGLPLAR